MKIILVIIFRVLSSQRQSARQPQEFIASFTVVYRTGKLEIRVSTSAVAETISTHPFTLMVFVCTLAYLGRAIGWEELYGSHE